MNPNQLILRVGEPILQPAYTAGWSKGDAEITRWHNMPAKYVIPVEVSLEGLSKTPPISKPPLLPAGEDDFEAQSVNSERMAVYYASIKKFEVILSEDELGREAETLFYHQRLEKMEEWERGLSSAQYLSASESEALSMTREKAKALSGRYYRAEKQEDAVVVDAQKLSELEGKERNCVFNKLAGYEVTSEEMQAWNSELLAEAERKKQEKENSLTRLREAAQKIAKETQKPAFVRQLSFYDADDFDNSERGIVIVSEYIDAAGILSKRESVS